MLGGMANTTDYVAWTDEVALSTLVDPQEPYWLVDAITHPDEDVSFGFRCRTIRGGNYLVEMMGEDEKLVLTEKSRRAMMKYIEAEHMDGMDPESFYGYSNHLRDDGDRA